MSGRTTKRAPAAPVCDLERLRAACAAAFALKTLNPPSGPDAIFAEVTAPPKSAAQLDYISVRAIVCLTMGDDDAILDRLFSLVSMHSVRESYDSHRTEEYMHGKIGDVLVFLEGNGIVEGLMQHGPGACRYVAPEGGAS